MSRYINETDAVVNGFDIDNAPSIHQTGSVIGMQRKYPSVWKSGGQVRVGNFIYNLGPEEVGRARSLGILKE